MKKGSVILSEEEYKSKLHVMHCHGFDYERFSEEWEQTRTKLKNLCNNKPDKVIRTILGCRYKGGEEL